MGIIYFSLGSGIDGSLQVNFLNTHRSQHDRFLFEVKISCHFGDDVT
jgi:hypothetical protein